MRAFDELEKHLQEEAINIADNHVAGSNKEIAKWQSQIETVNDGANLLSVVLQNGTDKL